MKARICCISDLHGALPVVPNCDLLLLGGDYCASFRPVDMIEFMHLRFGLWVYEQSQFRTVIGIAGNHDLIFEWPTYEHIEHLRWTYLQDSGTEWNGLKIWGTPWQPIFYNWAFNLNEEELCKKWALIPDDTDILIVHGPPHGISDWVSRDKVNTGSPGLLERIEQINPRLVVTGHIHSGYGQYQIGDTLIVNASLMDEAYHPVNPPQVIELDI